jgi:hypothetical protein
MLLTTKIIDRLIKDIMGLNLSILFLSIVAISAALSTPVTKCQGKAVQIEEGNDIPYFLSTFKLSYAQFKEYNRNIEMNSELVPGGFVCVSAGSSIEVSSIDESPPRADMKRKITD